MNTLQDIILDRLVKVGGRESVSSLTEYLRGPVPGSRRCYGPAPRFPAGHSAAMDAFEKLGFTIDRVYGKNRHSPLRWDVTL